MRQKVSAVVTTIGSPVSHIENLDKLSRQVGGSGLYIVGDDKTPASWSETKVNFFPIQKQLDSEFGLLANLLPRNHYSRKNLGYLFSVLSGDEWIYETDDDNYLTLAEGFQSFFNEPYSLTEFKDNSWVNVYSDFYPKSELNEDLFIWPRGFPLDLLPMGNKVEAIGSFETNFDDVLLFNGLVDNDPDVDAIYRLTHSLPATFSRKNHLVVLSKDAISPFNSQNTMWHKSLLPLMYLPITTSFRVTDILRSYIANVLILNSGKSIAFSSPNAVQYRNEHDLLDDLDQEFLLYLKARDLVDLIKANASGNLTQSDNMWNVYSSLLKDGYVKDEEMRSLEVWLTACKSTLV